MPAPWKLSDNEWDGIWECAATLMAGELHIASISEAIKIDTEPEHQGHDLLYRRARMLLVGLGLLDISRIIDFRDPPLKSFEGRVQGILAALLISATKVDKI